MNFKESDLMPLYKEMAEIIGVEQTWKIYKHFKGQQVLFPQRIYNLEFVKKYVREHYNGKNAGELGRKFGYSERRIRQFLAKKD